MRTTTRLRLLPALFSLVLLAPGLPSLAAQDPPGNAAAGGNPGKQGPRYRGEELLVRFSPLLGKGAKEDAIRRRGFRKIREFPSLDLFHVKTRPNQTVEEARDEFLAEPGVLYAEPNHVLTIGLVPDDPRFPEQWGFRNTGQSGGMPSADIDAPSAWDLWTGSDNAVVAVNDTGIDYRHGDLAGNLWINSAELYGRPGVDDDGNGYVDDIHGIDTLNRDADPMDDNQHGTHVAGVIGAIGNNGTGVAGVNWTVRLMACKFLGADGSGSVADAIECLEYVRQMRSRGVNVVATNNSYGMGDHSQALYDAIDAQREILFVAAAGNSSQDVDRTPSYPASYFLPNILSVGATGPDDALAYFSNYGVQTVLVAAPGVDVLSTLPGGSYGALSGTSMAAPHLTGLAALVGSYRPGPGWAGVRNRILAGGEDLPSLAGTSVTGRRANAFLALSCENRPLMAPWKYSFTAGVAGTLAALSIDCDSPAGPVTVTASNNETVTLRDDGVLPDLAAGDGIFTAEWTPAAEVTELTFTSPAGTRTVTPPSLADLAVVSVSGPSTAETGETIRLSALIRNAGKQETGLFVVTFHLSTDPAISSADVSLGSAVVWILGAGSERTVSIDAAIPPNLASGTYYAGAVADTTGWIEESDESNNTGPGAPISITRVYPDLVMTSVSGPSSAETGRPITLAGTVMNQGRIKAGAFSVGFYLSTDDRISTKDVYVGSVSVPSLGAGSGQTISFTGTVPSTLSVGTYFVGAVADSTGLVAESDEGNNPLAGNPVAVTRLYPDLVVVSVSGPPSGLTGQTVPVTVIVRNAGTGAAPSAYLNVYLSKDAAITTLDTRIGYVFAPALPAGAEQTITVNGTIPAAQAPGTWYLGAIADAFSSIAEPDESNNALAGNTLQVSGSDLAVLSVSGPTSGFTGQAVPVTVTIRNLGPGAAPSSYLHVYLSKDAVITALDSRIGYVFAPALPAGAEQTITVNGTIPAAQAPGTWYLGAIAD
ncbi:MAG TPA: CARDB domain-containing protein, partial [Candidatus Deferrimicrobiaceae bacterium]